MEQVVAAGETAARTLTHAHILLKADSSTAGPAWSDRGYRRGPFSPCFQAGDEWPAPLRTRMLCAMCEMLADAGMRKTCKYRLYPTNEQRRLLQRQLEECRWLYHHLLAERRDAWEQRQESVRLDDQHATLPARKAERPTLAGGQSPVLQDVARTSRSALIWPSRRSSAA